jgi:hypothetical protein
MPNELSVSISGQPIAVTVSGTSLPTAQLSVPGVPTATVSGATAAGVSSVAQLTDVQLSGLADGDVLRFSGDANKWQNYPETTLLDAGNF